MFFDFMYIYCSYLSFNYLIMNDINRVSIENWNTGWKEDISIVQIQKSTSEEIIDVLTQEMPNIGQDIYLDTQLYLSRGADDFIWWLATVNMVKKGENGTVWFSVIEKPGSTMNWIPYRNKQKELQQKFWDQRAYPDPDHRPEFNTWD